MKHMEEPHIVQEFNIGNTRVKIADNYCADKTPGDVQKVLDKMARTAQEHFAAEAYRELH